MNKSLNKLILNLATDQLKVATKYLKTAPCYKKGVFPYDHVDSFEKYKETELPPKDQFTSKMTGDEIKEKSIHGYENVLQTHGEYSALYLKQSVLLLADVFENFRDVCLETYALDPCWYFTTPGLTWDAMLKMTKIKLQMITDMDMFLMI